MLDDNQFTVALRGHYQFAKRIDYHRIGILKIQRLRVPGSDIGSGRIAVQDAGKDRLFPRQLERHDRRCSIWIDQRSGRAQVHRLVVEVDIVVATFLWSGAKLINLLLAALQIDYRQVGIAILILQRPELISVRIEPQSVVVTYDGKILYQGSFEIILDDITHCAAGTIWGASVAIADKYIRRTEGYRIGSTQTRWRGGEGCDGIRSDRDHLRVT